MRTWSLHSQKVYDRLDPRLQKLVTRLRDEVADITLVSGYRDRDEQEALFAANATEKHWPDSKHNKLPSIAVDVQPYPYPTDPNHLWSGLGYIAGRAFGIAAEEGFSIRWGGDWDGDGDVTNQKFDDLFHLEILHDR